MNNLFLLKKSICVVLMLMSSTLSFGMFTVCSKNFSPKVNRLAKPLSLQKIKAFQKMSDKRDPLYNAIDYNDVDFINASPKNINGSLDTNYCRNLKLLEYAIVNNKEEVFVALVESDIFSSNGYSYSDEVNRNVTGPISDDIEKMSNITSERKKKFQYLFNKHDSSPMITDRRFKGPNGIVFSRNDSIIFDGGDCAPKTEASGWCTIF